MKSYKCFCELCGRKYEKDMTPEEFRTLVASGPHSITREGYLRIACDGCPRHPEKRAA